MESGAVLPLQLHFIVLHIPLLQKKREERSTVTRVDVHVGDRPPDQLFGRPTGQPERRGRQHANDPALVGLIVKIFQRFEDPPVLDLALPQRSPRSACARRLPRSRPLGGGELCRALLDPRLQLGVRVAQPLFRMLPVKTPCLHERRHVVKGLGPAGLFRQGYETGRSVCPSRLRRRDASRRPGG